MGYTNATKVSNFLQRSLNSYETAEIDSIISAVKTWLDKELSSTFDEVSATTRYYDGGLRSIDIDPCTAINEVESIDDDGNNSYTYTVGSEYIAEPQNETVKRELRKRFAPFPRGTHRIAVTAKFSEYDGGVPADIELAATRLVAGVMKAGSDVSTGDIKSESLEGHSITYSDAASDSSISGIAVSDPTVSAILNSRRELMVDDYQEPYDSDYDDGGIMV